MTGSPTGLLGSKMVARMDSEVTPSLEKTTLETSEAVGAIKIALTESRLVAAGPLSKMSTTAKRLPVLPLRQLSDILQLSPTERT